MDQVAVNIEDGIAILFGDDMRVQIFSNMVCAMVPLA